MTTATIINGRKLVNGKCSCGKVVQLWLKDGQPVACLDCREQADRIQNGWTPQNSRD